MADQWLSRGSDEGSHHGSDHGAGRRSYIGKTSNCVVALVLAASLIGNGCAGVVMGSNSSGSGGKPPGGTPPPANAPQPQLSATPMSASFPLVAAGTSGSQTITLQNDGTSGVTISSAAVTRAGFSTSCLQLSICIAARLTMEVHQTSSTHC